MKRSAPAADSSTPAPTPESPAAASLEEALKELEAIVGRMEDPATPLESAIELYSRGMKLSQYCADRLAGLEKQVLLLQKGPDDQAKFVEFQPEESDS